MATWGEGANLHIGSFNSISKDVRIFAGGNHRTDWVTTFPFGHVFNQEFPAGEVNGAQHPATNGDVIIENDVWIGEGAVIMSGITLASGSVIAAYSVVTKDVAAYTIVGGNPAKPIRQRFEPHIIETLLELRWWDLGDDQINQIIPMLQSKMTAENLERILNVIGSSIRFSSRPA